MRNRSRALRRRASLATALAAVALAGATPATAGAGTYHVKACFHLPGYGWVGNGSWWPDAPTEFAAAYTQCPGDGIVTRMTGGAGSAGWGAGASHVLAAPPGTRIVRFSGSVNVHETRGWYAGLVDATRPAWVWCGIGTCSTWGSYQQIDVPLDTTRLHGQVTCGAGTCPRSALYGIFAMRDVVVTIADDTPPSVAITGGLTSPSGWLRGNQEVQFSASDGAGIRSVKVFLDGEVRGARDGACSDFQVRPCQDQSGPMTITGESFGPDGRHVVAVRAWDAAGNSAGQEREVWTDRTPPAQPIEPRLEGPDGWRPTNRFTVRWSNPPQDASAIASARFEICPAANPPRDRKGCVSGENRARNVQALDGLRVPGPGEWRLSLWLEDAAGNQDPERSATVATLRFDDAPPTLAFLPHDAEDPTRVKVGVSDSVSGVAQVQIELRRKGEDAWRALSTTRGLTQFDAIVDDEALPSGEYDLRARAVDLAGNERSTQSRQDGRPAMMSLPVRISTRVVVGRRTRVQARGSNGRRYRTILVVRPRAAFGRTIPLAGRATMPGGNPLADVDLEVWEQLRVPSATWRRIATVRTSRRGMFRFKALRGPARLLRFRYPGTPTIRGRTAEVDLRIRAATSFRVSRSSVVNGEEVTFHGRLKGDHIGDAGKLIQLQVLSRGRWLTFATPRATQGSGRWQHRYRFSATRGRVRYRFRARVPRESGYPYDGGRSRHVEVSVRGL